MANAVLGHYPDYVRLAGSIHSATRFSVPANQWARMPPTARWAANVRFLQAAIAQNDRFVFSHHPARARRGSSYFYELRYLRARGVRVVPTLNAYVPP